MRIATDLTVRPEHLPLVPLVQALCSSDNPHDDWWITHDPHGAGVVSAQHRLTDSLGDLFVVPLDWYWVRGPSWASRVDHDLRRSIRRSVERANGPAVVFFTGDRSGDRVGLDDAIVFREGARRSRMKRNDRPMPAFCDDLPSLYLDGDIVVRPRRSRPTIGFCGLARERTSPIDRLREFAAHATVLAREQRMDRSPLFGERLRMRCLDLLRRHPGVDTEFVVRDASVFFGASDVTDVRHQYVDNMVECDYVLCIRGSGNYSYRLYESLSMGRVPVIVDTDLALPASDRVPWREIAVWVDERDVDSIGDLVAEDHARTPDRAHRDRQHRLRQLWCEHLRARSWLANLDDHLAPEADGVDGQN